MLTLTFYFFYKSNAYVSCAPCKNNQFDDCGQYQAEQDHTPPHPLLWAISINNACPLHIEISKSGRIGWVHVKIILYLIYFISWLGLYCTVDKIEIFKIFRFVRIYLICHFHTRFFYRGWLKIIYITWTDGVTNYEINDRK